MRALALLSLLALLAGCAGPDDAPAPSTTATTSPTAGVTGPPGNATLAPAQPSLHLEECDQWHAFFPFPLAAFQENAVVEDPLPEGFTLAGDDAGATTNVFVDTGRCGPDGATATFAIHFLVQPPAELDQGPDDLDLYTFQAATNDAALRAFLAAANVTWADAAFTFDTAPAAPGALLEHVAVDTPAVDYSLELATQAAPGSFDLTYAIWHKGPDGRADGHLEWDNSNATNIGDGQALYAAAGTEGSPPALPGLLHRVGTTDVRVRWVPVATISPE